MSIVYWRDGGETEDGVRACFNQRKLMKTAVGYDEYF